MHAIASSASTHECDRPRVSAKPIASALIRKAGSVAAPKRNASKPGMCDSAAPISVGAASTKFEFAPSTV
jgi:hypothetical protein